MAKPTQHPKFTPEENLPAESVTVTVMRRVAPERFEVLTGVVTGPLSEVKVLERSVSLMVGRQTASKHLRKQLEASLAKLGLPVGS